MKPLLRHRLAFFALSVAITLFVPEFWTTPGSYVEVVVFALVCFWVEVKVFGSWVERRMGWDKPRK